MRWLCSLMVLLAIGLPALHAESPTKLRVGIFDRPPFATKTADGHWEGLAVDVWERISGELGLPFEYVETPFEQVFDDTANGRLDVILGEVGVSTDRARRVEFSQPYLATPAAVALLRASRVPHWVDFTRDVLDHGVGSLLIVLFVSLVIFSIILWLVERGVDKSHFGGKGLQGFGAALWFAAVTMTTVGYGDQTPKSPAGRAVVFFWMFFGVVIISVFTGAVASSIAVSRMENQVRRTSDLAAFRTGVMDGSITQTVLSNIGVTTRVFPTIEAGLNALVAKKITAFADGEVSLRFLVNRNYPGEISVDPLPQTHFTYAFAFRPDFSPELVKAINIALISQVTLPGWEASVERWIGPPAR